VATDDAEEEELRAVALKNAESILIARRRAEIALLDIGMPALNGYEVAQTSEKRCPHPRYV
jgi:DNA-binding NarL/FixJ family response regulator